MWDYKSQPRPPPTPADKATTLSVGLLTLTGVYFLPYLIYLPYPRQGLPLDYRRSPSPTKSLHHQDDRITAFDNEARHSR